MTLIHTHSLSAPVEVNPVPRQRAIVISTPVRNLQEFTALAEYAVRLKRFGPVEVNIGSLATKSRHEIPAGGSPWHEYAAWNPSLYKFFPHKLIAPFIPADFVQANRELLLAKARILRELGLGAAFWSYEPNFLPEAFFEAYPHLRGPRVDHPRRSRKEEFAMCTDLDETRQIITSMVRELVSHVPELGTFYFKTNDAGPGLCWADWQYSGPNGPSHCRHQDAGLRVRQLLGAIQRGAELAGGKLHVHMTGNFSRLELRSIQQAIPEHCYVRSLTSGSIGLGSMVDVCYPVRGIFEPLGLLHSLQKLKDHAPDALFVDFRSYYDRAHERPEIAEKVIDLLADFLSEPAWGLIPLLQRLRRWCDQWVGTSKAQTLFDALVEFHETMKFRRAALPALSTIYGGVSLRYITRPLMFDPCRLTSEEEAYFLTHVFNPSVQKGRTDYLDIHGARPVTTSLLRDTGDPRLSAAGQLLSRLESVARQLETMADTEQTRIFAHMSRSIRIYKSIVQSCANFYAAQIIRDRHPVLGQAPGTNDAGDGDLLIFNDIARDELDNTQKLIDLLSEEGMDLICHASNAADEDTFLLGNDLIAQLKRKRTLMRQHWLDIEAHLDSPLK